MRMRRQDEAASRGRTPKPRASFALAVVTLLGLLPVGVHADDARHPDLLYRRVFIIGDRNAIKSDPDAGKSFNPYTYDPSFGAAKELVVTDRRPEIPPPCGAKIAQRFLDRLLARFHVQAVNACKMAPSVVNCPSEYLPSYSTRKIFLQLDYAHAAQKAKLELDIFQREPDGKVTLSTLDEADRNWYNELYIELKEQVYCQ